MTLPHIYLDYAATAPMAEEIAEHLTGLIGQRWSNPASLHRSGRQARAFLEHAKEQLLALLLGPAARSYSDWRAWQVIITSGGTEANNLALHGLREPTAPLIVGATEHPSVLQPAQQARQLAAYTRLLPVLPSSGLANIDALDTLLTEYQHHTARPLVSVMVGNNETGILNDIKAVSSVCRRHAARLHTDAVQAVGKVDMSELLPLVDAVSISAHKLQGPVGVGALLVREQLHPLPLFFGGGQQLGVRPGTESLVLTSGLVAACQRAEQLRKSGAMEELVKRREHFETRLLAAVGSARLIGAAAPRLPHISCFAFPGWDRQGLLMALDMAGIECSSGSACASGSSLPSHVLSAMQLPEQWVASAIRFSLGTETSLAVLEMAIQRITDIFSKTK